ncbi:MAG: FimB/Mfa2 family fimbrial subunit [Rikenellaceae bacterium]|nr:FimB/Mfa2 family fimbrial subunit [Rikenellaceae bacterium]
MKALQYVALALALTACREQRLAEAPQQGRVTVNFRVTLPPPAPVATRAWADTDVDNVDLLVFDHNGLFVERIAATNLSGQGSACNFSARMEVSNKPRTVYFVANGRLPATGGDRVNFASVTPGLPDTTAIPGLRTIPDLTATTTDDILPLAMWGRATLASVTSSMTIGDLKLLRAAACIEVGTLAPDAANGLGRFAFTAFSIDGAAVRGKVAPVDYRSPAAVPSAPNAAGIPDMNYYIDAASGRWAQASSPTLYAYERNNSAADHASLIIRGAYDGQDGYYRIVMVDASGTPLDIVRNHRYTVTIVRAGGVGYPTIAEALANAPSNALKVAIVDGRDEVALIATDGQNELGISNNTVVIRGLDTVARHDVVSVYATRSASLAVRNSCPALVDVAISAPDSRGMCRISARCAGAEGTGTLTLTDGSLRQTIAVEIAAFAKGLSEASDSLYVSAPFFSAADRPWRAELMAGAQYIWLHHSASAAPTYPGGLATTWGLASISSANFARADLYVHRNAAVRGTLGYSRMSGAGQTVARMIFNK